MYRDVLPRELPPNAPADGRFGGAVDKARPLKEGAPGPRASASAAEQHMKVVTSAKSATRFMRASYEQSCGNGAVGSGASKRLDRCPRQSMPPNQFYPWMQLLCVSHVTPAAS